MWHNSLQAIDLSIDLNNHSWSWLSYKGSLTKYLQQKAGRESLEIKLVNQSWRMPTSEQKQRLNIIDNTEILEREIIMSVINRPWLFARSYFTKQSADYFGNKLDTLNSSSLGYLIMQYFPNIIRNDFQFKFIENNNSLFSYILKILNNYNLNINTEDNIVKNKLIVRRSLFYLPSENKSNNICFNLDEVFLPELVNKMLNLEVCQTI